MTSECGHTKNLQLPTGLGSYMPIHLCRSMECHCFTNALLYLRRSMECHCFTNALLHLCRSMECQCFTNALPYLCRSMECHFFYKSASLLMPVNGVSFLYNCASCETHLICFNFDAPGFNNVCDALDVKVGHSL